ncbi:hypothetical protein HO133_003798 [Letharia lupina]|uniref:Uncharacterized protein n=1 Tax=Letharia lupina TaxID=560253 RepID=A0A8H6CAI9_9LECA|nr:uncharacterized protein HO133_003798 [Letharia lupina]KAF6219973.1 hypothetical protein HO133_003798 [Letharia lupina]
MSSSHQSYRVSKQPLATNVRENPKRHLKLDLNTLQTLERSQKPRSSTDYYVSNPESYERLAATGSSGRTPQQVEADAKRYQREVEPHAKRYQRNQRRREGERGPTGGLEDELRMR